MSSFVSNRMIDKAVYWSAGTADGYGGVSFGTASEISCVWQDSAIIKKATNAGQPNQSNLLEAYIITETELEVDGYLFHGELSNLPSSHTNPVLIPNCYRISAVSAKKRLNSTIVEYYQIALQNE